MGSGMPIVPNSDTIEPMPPSPLLGYNTNVRHKGKLYHIQTEDSGVNRPHIITHLFADGGRLPRDSRAGCLEGHSLGGQR